MVMPIGDRIIELVSRVLVGRDDTVNDARFFEHYEVPVGR
jgi:hypothetical protein